MIADAAGICTDGAGQIERMPSQVAVRKALLGIAIALQALGVLGAGPPAIANDRRRSFDLRSRVRWWGRAWQESART
jgi:hypothetical protein